MVLLGVNIDHIATLRQARRGIEPDPAMAVPLVILGGADGITLHLREDRRHVHDRDLAMIKGMCPIELNLEMAATREMVRIAVMKRPDLVTIVPEKRHELTTEGGLDLKASGKKLKSAIQSLRNEGLTVSLFVNPDPDDIERSIDLGAGMVEVHTGAYANARGRKISAELQRVVRAVGHGIRLGLSVNAGHGLNYLNTPSIAAIPGLRGLYIGHSIISRAIYIGVQRAVEEMKSLIRASQS